MGLRALILVIFTDIAGIYDGRFLIERKNVSYCSGRMLDGMGNILLFLQPS
jgi:hypothetical protein